MLEKTKKILYNGNMSELQAKTLSLVQILPEEKVKLIFALLFETALNNESFKNDMEYFNSIPGYVKSLQLAAKTPLQNCTEDIGWTIA